MKEIKVDRTTYQKALRNVHPSDHFDPTKRMVNRVGRITARLLNNDPDFIDALKQGKQWKAGTIFHNKAAHVLRAMVARGKAPRGTTMTAEETIRAGRGGSRTDVLARNAAGRPVAEFDYKSNGRAALRGIAQMDKHADHLQEIPNGARPAIQESRNWQDYVREGAKKAAKFLPKPKPAGAPSAKPNPASLRASPVSGKLPTKPIAAVQPKPPPVRRVKCGRQAPHLAIDRRRGQAHWRGDPAGRALGGRKPAGGQRRPVTQLDADIGTLHARGGWPPIKDHASRPAIVFVVRGAAACARDRCSGLHIRGQATSMP